MNKFDEDRIYSSRFTAINLMRSAAKRPPLDWGTFRRSGWASVETETENARQEYNRVLKNEGVGK